MYEGAFPAEPSSVARVREALGGVARSCGLDARGVSEVLLAVTEAVTNSIVHGRGDRHTTIRVSAERVGAELEVVVADEGGGHRPRVAGGGAGLGMSIMAATAQRVEIRSEAHGTTVRLGFPCFGVQAG